MSDNALSTLDEPTELATYGSSQQQFVTMRLGDQWLGISVMAVHDVLRNLHISPVPLAPDSIAGSLNIRGRVVTAIDMRKRLHITTKAAANTQTMYVVVEYEQELFALMVDAVGDVLTLSMRDFESIPSNFDSGWRDIAAGVFKLDRGLMVVVDVIHVIDGIGT
jgi:purine-binding chemotaxis protein CheW